MRAIFRTGTHLGLARGAGSAARACEVQSLQDAEAVLLVAMDLHREQVLLEAPAKLQERWAH